MKKPMKSHRWERTLRDSLMIERCVALDQNGHQCRKWASEVKWYHGDNEIYDYNGPQPKWVRAALCDKHKGE